MKQQILRAGLAAALALAGSAIAAPQDSLFPPSGLPGGAGLFPKSGAAQAPAVQAKLLAAQDAAVPGSRMQLAVQLSHKPGWHTYWRNPGDAGAPTELEWRLPQGWKTGVPLWPVPRAEAAAGLVTYTMAGEALLPVTVSVPAAAKGAARLSVKVSWVACKEQCVPGEQTASLELPVARSATASADAAAIERAAAEAPHPAPAGFARARLSGGRLLLIVPGEFSRLEFFPDSQGLIDASRPPRAIVRNGLTALVLQAASGLKPEGAEVRGVLRLSPKDGSRRSLEIRPRLQALESASPFAGALSEEKARQASSGPREAAPAGEANSEAGRLTLLTAALFAGLGGLILNLMPCVFPVLSLKLLGLVRASKEKSLLPHGLAFSAGVLLSMAALSGALLLFKALGSSIGWGFQLQSPLVVMGLCLLFLAITLNLAGLYEFTLGSRAAGSLAMKSPSQGLSGSFFTGILAVIVASPCTAPFMGAAIGFALAQPAAEALAVFLSLGCGMAVPWLLLTAFPGWTRRLPRPGAWMATLKRCMAIPVALALAWLLWVLSRQVSAAGLSAALAALALLAAALLLIGQAQRSARPGAGAARITLAACLALSILAGSLKPPAAQAPADQGWQPWSEAAVSEALARGDPVFIDFTAAWCLTCQVNKKAVLDSSEVQAAFKTRGFQLFLADWTSKDEAISRELDRYRHSGVPLYLVLRPDGAVQVLPELLTREALIAALGPAQR